MTLKKLNLIVVGLVIGVTAIFVAAIVLPGVKRLKEHRGALEQKVQAVRVEQERVGNIGELYASILQMDERLTDYGRRLPSERQFGDFLKALSDQLKLVGIEQNLVQQMAERRLDEAKLPPSLKAVARTGILPVQVSFNSSFTQLFDFLAAVEALPRLSHIESMELVNDETNPGRVHAEIVFHTYYNPDDAANPSRLQEDLRS